ncbi:hypothetical protein SBV1_3310002 [Verrucomicrobia bacterium]|nr:hypothetical protein SBV1_3310002 [Verrucomicrobiota bacterium]
MEQASSLLTLTASYTYNLANQPLTESWSGGPLGGFSVTNGYDGLMRRTNLALLNSQALVFPATIYGYDAASRLQSVSDGAGNSVTYSYLANSLLVSQISFTNSSALRMTTTKQYDFLNRLTSISSVPSASSAVSFSYSYNNALPREILARKACPLVVDQRSHCCRLGSWGPYLTGRASAPAPPRRTAATGCTSMTPWARSSAGTSFGRMNPPWPANNLITSSTISATGHKRWQAATKMVGTSASPPTMPTP